MKGFRKKFSAWMFWRLEPNKEMDLRSGKMTDEEKLKLVNSFLDQEAKDKVIKQHKDSVTNTYDNLKKAYRKFESVSRNDFKRNYNIVEEINGLARDYLYQVEEYQNICEQYDKN